MNIDIVKMIPCTITLKVKNYTFIMNMFYNTYQETRKDLNLIFNGRITFFH